MVEYGLHMTDPQDTVLHAVACWDQRGARFPTSQVNVGLAWLEKIPTLDTKKGTQYVDVSAMWRVSALLPYIKTLIESRS